LSGTDSFEGEGSSEDAAEFAVDCVGVTIGDCVLLGVTECTGVTGGCCGFADPVPIFKSFLREPVSEEALAFNFGSEFEGVSGGVVVVVDGFELEEGGGD